MNTEPLNDPLLVEVMERLQALRRYGPGISTDSFILDLLMADVVTTAVSFSKQKVVTERDLADHTRTPLKWRAYAMELAVEWGYVVPTKWKGKLAWDAPPVTPQAMGN